MKYLAEVISQQFSMDPRSNSNEIIDFHDINIRITDTNMV